MPCLQVYWQNTVTGESQWANPASYSDMELLRRRHERGLDSYLPQIMDEYFVPLPEGEVLPAEEAVG